MERIFNRHSKRTVIVPMDHGVSVGPIKGLENMADTINDIAEGGADAVLMHKGIVGAGHRGYGRDIGLIIHLSGGTSLAPDPNAKVQVTSVKEAVRLGADAVSVHVNVGARNEPDMLHNLGMLSEECKEYGLPLLAMMYARGDKVKDELAVEYIKHAARVGAELGADIIKTAYTGDKDSFREVIRGCPAPVVIAGGPKIESDEDLFNMVKDSIDCGAAGVSIGRNIFQANNITQITQEICRIVHNKS